MSEELLSFSDCCSAFTEFTIGELGYSLQCTSCGRICRQLTENIVVDTLYNPNSTVESEDKKLRARKQAMLMAKDPTVGTVLDILCPSCKIPVKHFQESNHHFYICSKCRNEVKPQK